MSSGVDNSGTAGTCDALFWPGNSRSIIMEEGAGAVVCGVQTGVGFTGGGEGKLNPVTRGSFDGLFGEGVCTTETINGVGTTTAGSCEMIGTETTGIAVACGVETGEIVGTLITGICKSTCGKGEIFGTGTEGITGISANGIVAGEGNVGVVSTTGGDSGGKSIGGLYAVRTASEVPFAIVGLGGAPIEMENGFSSAL